MEVTTNQEVPAASASFTFKDVAEIYGELRPFASRLMRGERVGHSLQTTALMNEAMVRLMGNDWEKLAWDNPGHFIATFCTSMRNVLVDHARRRNADKRGGAAGRVAFNDAMAMCAEQPQQLLEIADLLQRMAADPSLVQPARKAQVVELRIFGGFSEEEIAAIQEVSINTARRDWKHAKAWLSVEMSEDMEVE